MMRGYTTVEQSKKLAEILPLGSADCCYIKYCTSDNNEWRYEGQPPMFLGEIPITEITAEHIPCWSLAALLDVLQNTARSIDEDGSVMLDSYKTVEWNLGINNSDLEFVTESNPVDAAVEMIVELKENNLL